jgi:hypothetical protein
LGLSLETAARRIGQLYHFDLSRPSAQKLYEHALAAAANAAPYQWHQKSMALRASTSLRRALDAAP